MNIETLLSTCEEQGILLWAEDEALRFKAPAGRLTPQLKQQLKDHKATILAYLNGQKSSGLRHDAEGRYQPFELTDLQLAYLVGRSSHYQYGGVGCHSYIELALPETDGQRLEQAWHSLILRHDMLRVVISSEGQQRVQETVTLPPVRQHDFTGLSAEQANSELLRLRDEMSHRCYDPESWPLFDVRLSRIPSENGGQSAILHFSIDLLIADFASIQILLAELGERYHRPEQALPALPYTFRDVMLSKKASLENPVRRARYEQHKQYWLEQLDTLPGPPELPVKVSNSATHSGETVKFHRRHFAMAPERWQLLRARAAQWKLTPSSVVLSAFTEILSRWSRHPEFCINLTLFNRPSEHPDFKSIIGDFIAVNVLGVRPQATDNFAQRTEKLQQQLWQDLEHNEFTGIDVLRALNQQRQENVLVPVVYTSTLGVKGDSLPENEFMRNARLNYGITQTPQVWLDCQTTERYDTLQLDWDVRSGVFPDGMIEAAFDALTRLLNQLADDETSWLSYSPVALPDEMASRHRLMNATAQPLQPQFLHSGFCRQALSQPDANAVIASDCQLSYLQLAQWALAIRRQLLEQGCRPDDRIAIVTEKSAAQVAAVLAVLLADATYVPIESQQPPARREAILADAGIKLVLTQQAYFSQRWPEQVTPVLIEPLPESMPTSAREETLSQLRALLTATESQNELSKERIGYIIFTSGTTGRPKGVMLSHFAAWNTVSEINKRFAVTPQDKVLGLASYSFDLSVWDLFGTLSAGACLVLPHAELRHSPEHWCEMIENHRVSLWNSVPAQLQMLVDWLEWDTELKLDSLRIGILSGDKIPVTLPQRIKNRLPQLLLIGSGGPTETAIWCIWHPIVNLPEHSVRVPYGVPLTNHQVHILNPRLEDCPDEVAGEMYIGGYGLAHGYVADEARTKERFIIHPRSGQRLYKSGDIGYYTPQGLIEILGREDNQVKIRGYRIELGEIEAACIKMADVSQAAAVAFVEQNRLAAALVLADDSQLSDSPQDIEKIRTQLKNELPDYMIPEQIVICQALPLNHNGKVDGKQVKQMLARQQVERTPDEPPHDSAVEQDLAAIWLDLLKLGSISRQDDFFHIGGSSLSAINLLSALLAKGYPATLEMIFANSSFHQMANALLASSDSQSQWLESIDLDDMARQALINLPKAQPWNETSKVQTLLLTGASGYLGIYTLSSLLKETDYTVYCLLRAKDRQDGFRRLTVAAQEKGVDLPDLESRVRIFCGDMATEHFALSEYDYAELTENVDVIIHNASIINLMDPLSALFPTNVQGVANILRLASTGKVKPVNYISTIAVHHALGDAGDEAVPESTEINEWLSLDLTYEQSKIMGENLIYRARKRGMPVNILRPATITWARTESPFINDDAFLKFYRACLDISAYPRSSLLVNLVPVDFVAQSVVTIVKTAVVNNQNFHLVSSDSLPVEQIYRWFNELGCNLESLDFADWLARLQDNFVAGFVNIYFKQGMDHGGHHQYDNAHLKKVLNQAGHSTVSLGRDYFAPLIRHFNNASDPETNHE